MEAVDELAAPPKDLSSPATAAAIAKGKRTKRHRPNSPIPFTIAPPQPPTAVAADDLLRRSPASSEESTTTEDVDTARCLMLLSRGGHFSPPYYPKHNNNSRTSAAGTAAKAAAGLYTCKTCNRAFPSFQALGGHRASHKKLKNDKRPTNFSDEELDFQSPINRISSNSLSLQLSNISTATTFSAAGKSSAPSPKIHECSYCGAEFTSGQALGGHMRKHRAGPIIRSPVIIPAAEASIEELEIEKTKKPRNGLSLDLNLPAPEDENQRFGLGPRQGKSPQEKNEAGAGLVLSTTATTTPALVDCHY